MIRLRYAKLALCEEHFVEYIHKRVRIIIEKALRHGMPKRIVAAVSGGKDSMVLLHILEKLSKTLPLKVYAAFIDLGIGDYSDRARKVVEDYCNDLGVELIILEVRKVLGISINELSRTVKKPVCSICGLVKRYFLNALGVEMGATIATGHHLDDIVSYVVKNVLTHLGEEHLKVSYLLPQAKGASAKVRPLIRISEREVLAYALLNNIKYFEGACPFAPRKSIDGLIKRVLTEIESEYPGTKLAILSKYEVPPEEISKALESSITCSSCGLISSSNVCAFCRYTQMVFDKAMGLEVRKYIKELVPKD